MDKEQALRRLAVLAARRLHLDAEINGLVAMLKSPDLDGRCEATWTEVGNALGITRQAAQQRYSGFSWAG
jgi:hypothetical protein